MIIYARSNFINDITTIVKKIINIFSNRIKVYNFLSAIQFGHDCLA